MIIIRMMMMIMTMMANNLLFQDYLTKFKLNNLLMKSAKLFNPKN